MMKSKGQQSGRVTIRGLAFIFACTALPWLLFAGPIPTSKPAHYPAWWFERDVVMRTDTNVSNPAWPTHYPPVDDYTAVNQGQLKHIAQQAHAELNARLPGGAGTNLTALINNFTTNNNYDVVNIGQVKNVAEVFYNRLIEVQYVTNSSMPWAGLTPVDDYAAANAGQVKKLFSFDLSAPEGQLPEWWQRYYFGETGIDPGEDGDGDGFTNLEEWENESHPDDYYNGVAPEITIYGGNNQTGYVSAFLGQPLIVRITNAYGFALANAPVTFAVSSGDGRVALQNVGSPTLYTTRTVQTDAEGFATIYGRGPSAAGTTVVTVSAGEGEAAVMTFYSIVEDEIVPPAGGDTAAPSVPATLVVLEKNDVGLVLKWNASTDNVKVAGYEVTADHVLVAEVAAVALPQAIISGLEPEAVLELRVRAKDSAGNFSEYSDELEVTMEANDLPAPWQHGEVGAVGKLGSATENSGAFTVKGSGIDVGGNKDALHYVFHPVEGNATLIARIDSQQNTHTQAKAGVMIRESLNTDARQVALMMTPSKEAQFLRRLEPAAATTVTKHTGITVAGTWLKLVRVGNEFTASRSSNGTTWTIIGTAEVSMEETVYVGLAVCSRNNAATSQAVFSNVSVDGAVPNLAPKVELTDPEPGDPPQSYVEVTAPSAVTLIAEASDANGIQKVEFYANDVKVGEDTSAVGLTYSVTWNATTVGDYELTAVAYDNLGKSAISAAIPLVVSPAVADSDSDGLLDAWEMKYFGNLTHDGSGDEDGDGINNEQEETAISNPLDYFNGLTPKIEIVGGDSQIGESGTFAGDPLKIRVVNPTGGALANAPVVFRVYRGDGLMTTVLSLEATRYSVYETVTNSSGEAQVYFLPLGLPSVSLVAVEAVGYEAVAYGIFEMTAETPRVPLVRFSLVNESYASSRTLVLDCSVSNAVIRYTTNGTEPTEASSSVPAGGFISYTLGQTIKAKGYAPDHQPGDTAVFHSARMGILSASSSYTLSRRTDGLVEGWGGNPHGIVNAATNSPGWEPFQREGLSNIVQIVAGESHALALRANGTVAAWGLNESSELGNGLQGGESRTPSSVRGLRQVIALAVGKSHSLALKSDGTVWAWGSNTNGQLGDGTQSNNRSLPVQVWGLNGVVAVAAGEKYSLALKSDGTVWAWGLATHGRLGTGNTTQRLTPVKVNGLSSIVSIAAGQGHSLALKSDGTVWTVGFNNFGALGLGDTEDRFTPVQVSSLASITIVSIAAGWNNSYAIESDGTVWAWGRNKYGELGIGTQGYEDSPVEVTSVTGVLAVAAGIDHAVFLKSDGTLRSFGQYRDGQLGDGTPVHRLLPVQVEGLTSVSQISSGSQHQVARTSDGKIWMWGRNSDWQALGFAYGSETDPLTESETPLELTALGSNNAAIEAGSYFTLALKTTGGVWGWGANWSGVLTDDEAIGEPLLPAALAELSGIAQLSAGESHALAIDTSGDVWSWGSNGSGQLGIGTIDNNLHAEPTAISGLSGISGISAGGLNSYFVVSSDGTVLASGENYDGQLGQGTSGASNGSRQEMLALEDMAKVRSCGRRFIGLKNDGTVWGWGWPYGNTPVQIGALDDDNVDVAVGEWHFLVLKDDGTVWAWGNNTFGQLGTDDTVSVWSTGDPEDVVPVQVEGLTSVTITAISAGGNSSMALDNNGEVWAWGWNREGQSGDGVELYKLTPATVTDLNLFSGDPDADNDGLADAWEEREFEDLDEDGTANADGDEWTDGQEYLNGTDPHDFFNGFTPVVELVSGGGQWADPATVLANPIVVRVKGPGGTPLENAEVTFTVSASGAGVSATSSGTMTSTLMLETDGDGEVTVYYKTGTAGETWETFEAEAGTTPRLGTIEITARSASDLDVELTVPEDAVEIP
jgi:alpha-tubulin suppressor-like RCC1 family protein/regulation of enolase protein 1 (concanavalin A-like superfamily)